MCHCLLFTEQLYRDVLLLCSLSSHTGMCHCLLFTEQLRDDWRASARDAEPVSAAG